MFYLRLQQRALFLTCRCVFPSESVLKRTYICFLLPLVRFCPGKWRLSKKTRRNTCQKSDGTNQALLWSFCAKVRAKLAANGTDRD